MGELVVIFAYFFGAACGLVLGFILGAAFEVGQRARRAARHPGETE